ncbi:MAG: PCMD domain-containing protein [Muribaculaceae bacterium]|nr:PCMD domain-containing protein [Muribaculaceae bacterium]
MISVRFLKNIVNGVRGFRNSGILTSGLVAMIVALVAAGCIKNDLPYPRIPQFILKLSAEGEKQAATIDSLAYKATIYLDETVDIQNVKFTEFRCTEGATADPDILEGTYDMTSPLTVTLSLYQDYEWTITAEQTIERYLTIEGQIGETVIDDVAHRILVRVQGNADVAHLKLLSIKLGPEGITTMEPALEPGEINLSEPLTVNVTCWDRTTEWTIYVERTETIVETTQVDAWSQVIWAYGNGPADVANSFQYRPADSETWIDIPASQVTQNEGAFSVCIPHLTPLTKYVVRAVSGENIANEFEVTTEATEDLIDGSFDQWWQNGRIWCPWNEGGTQFWDTGNTGAATLGQSNVVPSDDTPTGSGQSAKLETRFVGIAGIGKLAAGSIYTGKFVRVDGTNGILDFGRPWSVRPTKLRGYYKYNTAPINYASADLKYLIDRPDSCHIYVAMTDWTAPYEIRTNPKNRQIFDPASPDIIAYGELIRGSDTDGWQEFEIELKYRSTARIPSYIQITCAASKYGDFFTGGVGACLFVDQFSLIYDY